MKLNISDPWLHNLAEMIVCAMVSSISLGLGGTGGSNLANFWGALYLQVKEENEKGLRFVGGIGYGGYSGGETLFWITHSGRGSFFRLGIMYDLNWTYCGGKPPGFLCGLTVATLQERFAGEWRWLYPYAFQIGFCAPLGYSVYDETMHFGHLYLLVNVGNVPTGGVTLSSVGFGADFWIIRRE